MDSIARRVNYFLLYGKLRQLCFKDGALYRDFIFARAYTDHLILFLRREFSVSENRFSTNGTIAINYHLPRDTAAFPGFCKVTPRDKVAQMSIYSDDRTSELGDNIDEI